MIARVVPAVRLPYKAGSIYDYLVPENLSPAVKRGSVVVVPFAGRKVAGLVMETAEKSAVTKSLKEIYGIAEGLAELPPYIAELWSSLAGEFATTLPRFLWSALPSIPARATLHEAPPRVAEKTPGTASTSRGFMFSNACSETLEALKAELLAHKNRQTLILTPSIGEAVLLSKALPGSVVYHAGLSKGAKYGFAVAANSGRSCVVISTKSGVFLPFRDLALVVALSVGSQGHEQEDQDPRFDARIVGEDLSQAVGARFLAIDSLPPLGMSEALQDGKWKETNAPKIFQAQIHDLHDAGKAERKRVLLCEKLQEALDNKVAGGGRALLLLNRRGTAGSYACTDCGTFVNCPDCSVPLVIHQERTSCYACERSFPLPRECGRCHGLSFKTIGFGSKTLFALVKKRYPEAPIAHIDRDGSSYADLAKAQIIVGTSAVLAALFPLSSDFDLAADVLFGAGQGRSGIKSTESSARLLRTLASWVKSEGELHIQTFDTASPALKALHDPADFISRELEERRAFGYPPFKTMITLYGAGTDENKLWKEAAGLVVDIRSQMPFAVCGEPSWSRPKLFRRKYRLSFIIKIPNGENYGRLAQLLPAGFAAKISKL